jgi:ribonuclease BN (tRNA processing enzyme)
MGGTARLIVLGSGTSVPRADRATSCYLVDDGAGTVVLVDLGPGALHRAAAEGHDLDALSAVLLTHLHPDHCADLVALQFALRNPIPRAGAGPLPLLAHPDVTLLLARLRNAWPGWLAVGPERLRPVPVGPGPLPLPGRLRGEAHPIAHTATSLGFRLTLPDGFVLAFSGDATEGEGLLALGRDADLLVLEAACPDERPVEGHLTPRRAGQVAAACGARHLLLTHFYPPVLETPIEARTREGFEGRLTLAQDGMVLPLVAAPATR